jgi:hypothetical protein
MTQSAPPLSFAQEQLWFIDEFHHGLPAHNVPGLVWLDGELDEAALTGALAALVARHEPLRTRLAAGDGGRPVQLIDPPGPGPVLELASCLGMAAPDVERWLRELADADALRPFHLATDQPLRARLVRLAADSHALVLVAHQTAVDERSLPVLVAELAALYQGIASGQATRLPQLPVRFAGEAEREREHLRDSVPDGLADYWRSTLASLETSRFPATPGRSWPTTAARSRNCWRVPGCPAGCGSCAGRRAPRCR